MDPPFRRKCELLGVSPSTAYAQRKPGAGQRNEEDMTLAGRIEEIYLKYPFYGSRRIARKLSRDGSPVKRKRVQRLMRLMDLVGQAPALRRASRIRSTRPTLPFEERQHRASEPGMEQRHHLHSDQIRLLYLTAIVDWHSRRILACRLSNTMDVPFCTEALEEALEKFGTPKVFNTDQGTQFTSAAFTGILEAHGVAISMDGRECAFDNIFTERFWRNIKCEWLCLHSVESIKEIRPGLEEYIDFYNFIRHWTTKLQMRCILWQHKSKVFLPGLNLLSKELGPRHETFHQAS